MPKGGGVTPRHTAMALARSNESSEMCHCKVRSPEYLAHELRDTLLERVPAARIGSRGREPVVVLGVAEERRAARALGVDGARACRAEFAHNFVDAVTPPLIVHAAHCNAAAPHDRRKPRGAREQHIVVVGLFLLLRLLPRTREHERR